MKKLVLAFLIVSFIAGAGISIAENSSYTSELLAPFTKVKEYVEATGVETNPGIKTLIFKGVSIEDNIVDVQFATADTGNTGIAISQNDQIFIWVAYDAKNKVYFAVTAREGVFVISIDEATEWAFLIFRILVAKGLL